MKSYAGKLEAVRNSGQDISKLALEIYLSSFSSKTSRDFSAHIRKAIVVEKEALARFDFHQKKDRGGFFRCRAMISFLEYWLETKASAKKSLANKAWGDAKRALSFFDAVRKRKEYAETYTQLAFCAVLELSYEWNFQVRLQKIRDAIEISRRAAANAYRLTSREEAAKTLAKAALFLSKYGEDVLEHDKTHKFDIEALQYWRGALRRSRHAALLETAGLPNGFFPALDKQEESSLCEEALQLGRESGNNFIIGCLADQMAVRTFWKSRNEEDTKVRVRSAAAALRFSEEAGEKYEQFKFTSPTSGVMWPHSPYAEYFWFVAYRQTEPSQRRIFLEKGLKATRELLQLAKRSTFPAIMMYAHHITGSIALDLAEAEVDNKRKKKLLLYALVQRQGAVRASRVSDLPDHWNQSMLHWGIANVLKSLAELEPRAHLRQTKLVNAALNTEKSLDSASKYLHSLEKAANHLRRIQLGSLYRRLGNLQVQVSDLTRERDWMSRAAMTYTSAAEWLENSPKRAMRAECYWKAGKAYSILWAHTLASEIFALASTAYTVAAKKTPHLRQLYQDYASYMLAWNKIERAKAHHTASEFFLAGKYFREAAKHLRSTNRWNPLGDHYSAMAKLESAENHSREGDSTEAIRAFERAAQDFKKAEISSHELLIQIDQASEREMIENLMERQREEYCRARILTEEARLAENKHFYSSASEKYGLAAQRFNEISTTSKLESERSELAFQSSLAKAWQLSTRAELNNSVSLLLEAHDVLEKAKKSAANQTAISLASGHQHYCDAQIAIWKSLEGTVVSECEAALDHFAIAATCYSEAGYPAVAADATARKLALQAALQIRHANRQVGQKQREDSYESAAKLLHEAANAFDIARQPKEKMQVLSLADRAKKEWDLYYELTETLNGKTPTRSNLAVLAPGQGNETPGGLERFEQSGIEATLIVPEIIGSEDSLTYEVKIVNIGKEEVHLTSLEDAFPLGTEPMWVSENWHLNGRSIEPVHQSITPMEQEALRIQLRLPMEVGLVKIKPRVFFKDPRKSPHHIVLEERIILPSRIMRFLVNAFVRDFAAERISPDYCGWRSLMKIVNALKLPRSHVYGEPRYGRPFGTQLDVLMKSSLVESRVFPGERGRGGDIVRIRVKFSNEDVKDVLRMRQALHFQT